MFQIILDQHVWSTVRALKTHYSTIGISMTFNQQHPKQNSNTVTVILINNLLTSTEQLVLNHLTHKWKSCASPKVTKTWHNLFKKRYCLSSNSAVTDLLKNYIKKKLFNDVLESWFCGNVGKLCRLETFFCLTWDFFVAKLRWLNIRQHTFAHLCIVLFNSSITLTTIKAKVFILIKDWIAFPVFTHGSGSDFLCFLEWLVDWFIVWLIDWLTDWLTDKWPTDKWIDQSTNWLTEYLYMVTSSIMNYM